MRDLGALSRWFEREGLAVEELTPGRAEEFSAARRKAGCARRSASGATLALRFLRESGLVPTVSALMVAEGPLEELLSDYRRYLAGEHGLAESTICRYERVARLFFRDHEWGDELALQRLSAADVSGFLARECPKRTVSGARDLVAELRPLLRYLHVAGLISLSLRWAVPGVADLRDRSLPRGLEPATVAKLLRSCDRRRIDSDAEVPSKDLLPASCVRVAPYIYTDAEIAALMAEARALAPLLRAATYETLIGLMAASGLRIGEALGLDRQDVDLRDGSLHVRARQTKQREVPLHDSATNALRKYAKLRDQHWPDPKTHAFFVSRGGLRLTRSAVKDTFPKLIRRAGLEGRGQRVRPRPHDLRHTFAVRTLLDLHRAGAEVQRELPRLSTYLGHVDPSATYWYLQAVPELLQLVGRRLDGVFGEAP